MEKYRERKEKLAPAWAQEWPMFTIGALARRYIAPSFKNMTKVEVIVDMLKVPFQESDGVDQEMRERICERLGVECPSEISTTELRIKKLEARVELLEHIASNLKSYPGDSDLTSHYKDWSILYPMYGGFKISRNKEKWLEFENFTDLINYIQQN